MDITKI